MASSASVPRALLQVGTSVHFPALSTGLPQTLLQASTSVHFLRLCCRLVQVSTSSDFAAG